MSAPPVATCRLQLGRAQGFRAVAALAPYLARLGISHVYCSPWLRARAGSEHGYDTVDHDALHPEIGDEDDFRAFVAALRGEGLGLVLDFVPNHMGIGRADNAWWLDVLEHGRGSPWAAFFDVDWEPAQPALRGRVLLPVLGDHYGRVLEAGELRLVFARETGGFAVVYHEHRFPVSPRAVARVLRLHRKEAPPGAGVVDAWIAALARVSGPGASAERLADHRTSAAAVKREIAARTAAEPSLCAWLEAAAARWNGTPGRASSWRRLHRLLEKQHYRLAYWRVAGDEINYRRFFNVNELAALRMERPEVFEATHRRVLAWAREGTLDGLRIDHVDGLLDPKAYCERLREAVGQRPFWIVVEKILAHHESLRGDWPVDGTTGYEFLESVGGLFVDPAGEACLDRTWSRFATDATTFEDEVYRCKKLVLNFLFAGELQVMANALDRLSESHWSTRDFTGNAIREALKEVVACFPVYRSYVDAQGAAAEDRRDVDWALAQARRRSSDPEPSLFDWIHGVLTAEWGRAPGAPPREDVVAAAMRFQQLTAPVTAKALEDTSFYRHHRLASLAEVGGDPRRFGVSPAAFHRANAERQRRWPHAMTTTSTHDAKRGEDVRLRIHALSEIGAAWEERVEHWTAWNRRLKREVAGAPAPAPDDEYLLYQTLLGSWPHADGAAPDAATPWLAPWRERLEAHAVKALREAKRRSSWRQPDADYEAAHLDFLRGLLDASPPNPFLADLAGLAARVAAIGAAHSLGQVALRCTAPGVPDLYQGAELWDLALTDPDNRRPVDFALRTSLLEEIDARCAAGPDAARALLHELLDAWLDGRVKLFATSRLLRLRRRLAALFAQGDHAPLAARGPHAERVVGFARSLGGTQVAVVAARLVAPLLASPTAPRLAPAAWADTEFGLPPSAHPWRDLWTGAEAIAPHGDAGWQPASAFLAPMPLAVLVAGEGAA